MSFISVEATVERVFFDGKGIALVEEYTSNGEIRQNRFTAWFDEAPGLQVGQTGAFTGIHSVKIEEWTTDEGETKRKAAVSINKAKVKLGTGHTLNKPVEAPKATGWASSEPVVDSAPF